MRSKGCKTYNTLYTVVTMMRTADSATFTVFLLTTMYARKTTYAISMKR